VRDTDQAALKIAQEFFASTGKRPGTQIHAVIIQAAYAGAVRAFASVDRSPKGGDAEGGSIGDESAVAKPEALTL
jgi:hypothetical protein